MSETVVTVRDMFELPKPGSPEESAPRWQTLRQWISEDVKGVKAGAMPDVTAKIADLLEVRIAEIFLASWKKTVAVKQLLEESRKTPDALMNFELAEHSINSKHQPHIEIKAKNAAVKKIEFTLQLLFKLKGFNLQIQNGAIKEMQTGPCHAKGTLQYQGLAIAEKELAPIKLPATVALEASIKTDEKPAPNKAPATVSSENTAEKTPLEPPRPAVPVTQQPVSPPAEPYKLRPPVKVTTTINQLVPEVEKFEASEIAGEEVPPEGVPTEEEEEREQFVL
jgi:hypothetical protein